MINKSLTPPLSPRASLSSKLPPLIIGGAGFSHQLCPEPDKLPVASLLRRAFDHGLRAIDTSAYYEPSEEILGRALASPEIVDRYQREDYLLMTKVGRITATKFDYSPAWIRKSLDRSLQRLGTTYLDVVYCHDVEFVTVDEAVDAVGTLFEIARSGKVIHVGISSYDLDRMVEVASRCRERYGRPIDVVQPWAQLTLQNMQLQRKLPALRAAGVECVCASSPLAVGLLRKDGVPLGKLGDWHPAPPGLRDAAFKAAQWVESQGQDLAALALRFSMAQAKRMTTEDLAVVVITGCTLLEELETNVAAAKRILRSSCQCEKESATKLRTQALEELDSLDAAAEQEDLPMCRHVQTMLGSWLGYPLGSVAKL